MFSTEVYDYVNVLSKAADAAWLRNEAIANNIANQDTPGYKRQDVDFESALKQALESTGATNMDGMVHNVRKNALNVKTYTDHAGFSYRLDGNNVDVDTEQTELASNQIRYQAIMDSINGDFRSLQSAMK